jgi:hypothetical protein
MSCTKLSRLQALILFHMGRVFDSQWPRPTTSELIPRAVIRRSETWSGASGHRPSIAAEWHGRSRPQDSRPDRVITRRQIRLQKGRLNSKSRCEVLNFDFILNTIPREEGREDRRYNRLHLQYSRGTWTKIQAKTPAFSQIPWADRRFPRCEYRMTDKQDKKEE